MISCCFALWPSWALGLLLGINSTALKGERVWHALISALLYGFKISVLANPDASWSCLWHRTFPAVSCLCTGTAHRQNTL